MNAEGLLRDRIIWSNVRWMNRRDASELRKAVKEAKMIVESETATMSDVLASFGCSFSEWAMARWLTEHKSAWISDKRRQRSRKRRRSSSTEEKDLPLT